jgi:hypothetical protein
MGEVPDLAIDVITKEARRLIELRRFASTQIMLGSLKNGNAEFPNLWLG